MEQNQFHQSLHTTSIGTRAFQGAGIAVILLAVFLLGAEPGFQSWLILPMIAVAFAGACGGVFYFLMDRFRQEGGWKKALINVICVMVYIVGLWMSLILSCKVTGHWS